MMYKSISRGHAWSVITGRKTFSENTVGAKGPRLFKASNNSNTQHNCARFARLQNKSMFVICWFYDASLKIIIVPEICYNCATVGNGLHFHKARLDEIICC